MRNKSRQINFRVTEKEYNYIYKRSQKSNIPLSNFLLRSALDKEIVIIEGLPLIIIELRKIGVNINQLTKLSNEGRIATIEMFGVKKGLDNIWQSLNSLTRKVV